MYGESSWGQKVEQDLVDVLFKSLVVKFVLVKIIFGLQNLSGFLTVFIILFFLLLFPSSFLLGSFTFLNETENLLIEKHTNLGKYYHKIPN